jgi:hypothetical protein
MEIWKDVPGFVGQYQVSNEGRVKSFRRRKEGILLAPGRMTGGHMSVALGRGNSRCVHELVLLAFVAPRQPGQECLHGNGNPADNRLENIRWGTRSENLRDKTLHGQNKLKLSDVIAIKAALKNYRRGLQRQLAAQYGVAECTISAIKWGRQHAYIVG